MPCLSSLLWHRAGAHWSLVLPKVWVSGESSPCGESHHLCKILLLKQFWYWNFAEFQQKQCLFWRELCSISNFRHHVIMFLIYLSLTFTWGETFILCTCAPTLPFVHYFNLSLHLWLLYGSFSSSMFFFFLLWWTLIKVFFYGRCSSLCCVVVILF